MQEATNAFIEGGSCVSKMKLILRIEAEENEILGGNGGYKRVVISWSNTLCILKDIFNIQTPTIK